ncbi:src substrate cortactin-like [Pyrus ussuriensis x Pyrus communis]|uniref:Src substrate cortactin-like n=1 Tax=Pyrus ussuriensis x Pyrus communis TaxID=2448454 RepID=A0A5N5FBW2_9ROSA|nr:src substrate cortactin-like [Pyrus ussuriensis x Pyrus communis]
MFMDEEAKDESTHLLLTAKLNALQVIGPTQKHKILAPVTMWKFIANTWLDVKAIDVSRRQAKVRDSAGNVDIIMKLEAAEAKLQELQSSVAILGKEAGAAMAAVEGQQQRLTLQRLLAMTHRQREDAMEFYSFLVCTLIGFLLI